MENKELKPALLSGCPVVYNGITYKCVSAIIYRRNGHKVDVAVELMDKHKNSVTLANPARVKRKENENE